MGKLGAPLMTAPPGASPIRKHMRKHIHVRGIVQGVGFRPFVYKLASSLGLSGTVFNSSSGVTIEVEGQEPDLHLFVQVLKTGAPPLAEIASITVSPIAARGDKTFSILESREEAGEFALVPPDAGTCDLCWSDFGDRKNRRYGYAFTNCTYCGPRYTIVRDIPYDRAATTMAAFKMCAACRREYEDPNDRRFHAQPNACAVCGPSLCLVVRGTSLENCRFGGQESQPAIRRSRELLREGKILAVKGLGGFLLACDAANDAAVKELRKRKRRPTKPFALMARDLAAVRRMCSVAPEEESALLHPRRPIVLLPRLPGAAVDLNFAAVAPSVAPGCNTLGVMLPYTPLHYLLFSDSPEAPAEFPALVMTSGNLSEEPIVVSNAEALARLGGVADWFLLHNREIATRADDSITRVFAGRERVLRRARGFAPQSIDMGGPMREIAAFGAELKNTFCLTKGRYALLSQHLGDLENYETVRFFEETFEKMKHLFKVFPEACAYDLHPGYQSTKMALACGIARKIGVQHHHAHIASCMAENQLRGKVIGVALDGTGFGMDGKIWGGEFLVADFAGFERRGHLRNVLLPGGDAAVKQPWRMALSYLWDAFGEKLPFGYEGLPCFREAPAKHLSLVAQMIGQRIQTVETSSCGRLFDAVAALLGFAGEATFEGEAAIALETMAEQSVLTGRTVEPSILARYDFDLQPAANETAEIIDLRPAIAGIVQDIAGGRRAHDIAARFHNTLSAAIVEMCGRIRERDGLNRVCLSGGSFQNVLLVEQTARRLQRRGFGVFLHAVAPANDGGIALGQAAIANELLERGD